MLTRDNNNDNVTGTHEEDASGECQRSRTAKAGAVNTADGNGNKYNNGNGNCVVKMDMENIITFMK